MADQVFIGIFEYPVPMLRFHVLCFQFHAYYYLPEITILAYYSKNSEGWFGINIPS